MGLSKCVIVLTLIATGKNKNYKIIFIHCTLVMLKDLYNSVE